MTSLVRRIRRGRAAARGRVAGARRPRRRRSLQTGKPIRMIVGLAAGGGTDVMARLIAQKMSENMKARP